MSKRILEVGVLLVSFNLGTFIACGQESVTSAPASPLVAKSPTQGKWTIKYTRKDDAEASEATAAQDPVEAARRGMRLRKINLQTDGIFLQQVVTCQNGAKTEFWFTKKIGLCKNDSGVFRIIDPRFESPDLDLNSREFREFSWLSSQHYIGVVTLGERQCYYFKGKIVQAGPPGAQMPKVTQEAWIDVNTRLPVALNDGDAYREYEFDLASVPPLQLPAAFAKKLEKYNRKMKRYGM